jgi:hypothetical protein
MANVRPPRKTKFTRVDDDEEPELINPKREEKPSFFTDYDQMHQNSFRKSGDKPEVQSNKGTFDVNLESLVKTLASLQFTTKGKIDADGKVEIMFCSPEPIVLEEKSIPEAKLVEFGYPKEHYSRHKHSHRHKKRPKGLTWLAT